MELPLAAGDRLHRCQQGRIGKEIAVGNTFADLGQILIDDTPGADIKVPDLGIPHLPVRQADIEPGSGQGRGRILSKEGIEMRGPRRGYCISRPRLGFPPAIKDQQSDGHTHTVPQVSRSP